jgi:transcriptional regulator with XRE-family HTH domain
MPTEAFGERLRELREAREWTQTELAEKAGLTRDGVAHLEQGRRKPSWETVLALAAALGVSCEAFTTPPAEREAPGPGRPRKADPSPATDQAEPESRPGKAAGVPAAGRSAKGKAEGRAGKKKGKK